MFQEVYFLEQLQNGVFMPLSGGRKAGFCFLWRFLTGLLHRMSRRNLLKTLFLRDAFLLVGVVVVAGFYAGELKMRP